MVEVAHRVPKQCMGCVRIFSEPEARRLRHEPCSRSRIRKGSPSRITLKHLLLTLIHTDRYVSAVPRPTKQAPERGDARIRLLEAARDIVRAQGFAATCIDDICAKAQVTKGAFFHHFSSKEALGVAAAEFWAETTSALFAAAPYHAPLDPLERVLAYVAFRRAIIAGPMADFTCLAGTLVQEVHDTSVPIREACGRAILGHAATLVADIKAARRKHGIDDDWTAESLARHMQAVLQGAFILAKAGDDAELARESIDHLDRYIRLLFHVEKEKP